MLPVAAEFAVADYWVSVAVAAVLVAIVGVHLAAAAAAVESLD